MPVRVGTHCAGAAALPAEDMQVKSPCQVHVSTADGLCTTGRCQCLCSTSRAGNQIDAALCTAWLDTSFAGCTGYWSSWTAEVRDSTEFKQLLGLEAQDRCLGIFMLGVPREGAVAAYRSSRGPMSDKVTWKL